MLEFYQHSATPYCPAQNHSASKQWHGPYHMWSSTTYTSTNCTDGGLAYRTYYLDGASWYLSGFCATTDTSGNTSYGSVRCSFGFRSIVSSFEDILERRKIKLYTLLSVAKYQCK